MLSASYPERVRVLESLRDSVAASMQAHMGGASYCEIHKTGRVSGGLKYDEGRLVMVGAALRYARAHTGDAESFCEAMRAFLLRERAKWCDLLAMHQARASTSMAWVAYAQGGVDACESLLKEIQ